MKKINLFLFLLSFFNLAHAATYTWNGAGDGVSLYQEANWGGIPQIDPNIELLHNLVVNTGNVGGGGFNGNLFLGGNSLTINGGSIIANNNSAILSYSLGSVKSPININGGVINVKFVKNTSITISNDGNLILNGGGNPLNSSTINLIGSSNASILFTNESNAHFTSEHLSKITVDGSPAVIGSTIEIQAQGSGTLVTLSAPTSSSYTWNGSTNDDVFTESNWSNGSNNIPSIDAGIELSYDLEINSGTPGGTGFSGNLVLGGNSLTISGGTLTASSGAGITSSLTGSYLSDLNLEGGHLNSHYVVELNITMSNNAQLTLNGGVNPLNTSAIDINTGFTGQIYFSDELVTDVISEHLAKITVNGETAVEGCNVALTAQGNGTVVTTLGGTNCLEQAYAFDHTDTDGDGIPDTVEINLGLNPNDANSTLGQRPNIIYILVDDLGFGDLGKFYQDGRTDPKKFDTPHLDTMAEEGVMMKHHYVSAPVCAPSRSSFLEGLHQGHATVRNNQFDKVLPEELTTQNVMRNAGYYTAIVGKHGLAGTRPTGVVGESTTGLAGHPIKTGFDEFFGYLWHNEGHEHYPRNGTTDKKALLHDGFTNIQTNTDKVYTTDVFTARAKQIIMDRNAANPNQPFFLYLAYDVPHSKLQVPTMAYPTGKGVNGGLQWTGENGSPAYVNTNSGTIDSYIHPDFANKPWTTAEKAHVGMIRRVDNGVEDIIQTLIDLGIDDNTIIVFTSDNGPHNSQGQDPRSFDSYANMDGIKRDMWEAGIRVPTIVRWPGEIPANSVSNFPAGNWDWMTTFADLAKMNIPARADGVSLVDELKTPGSQTRNGSLYFEYQVNGSTPTYSDFEASRQGQNRGEMQAIRIGDFKGVRTNIGSHNKDFEIYNVLTDAKETTNLAASMPALQQQMKDETLRMRLANSSASRPYDGVQIPDLTINDPLETGLEYSYFSKKLIWIPDYNLMTPDAQGQSADIDLSVKQSTTDFGLYFKGYLEIPTAGSYTFYLETGAAAHINIHNIHILNDDYKATNVEKSITLQLEAGLHPIEVHYKHNAESTFQLDLSFEGPGISKQVIPSTYFKRLQQTCPSDAVTINLNDCDQANAGTVIDSLINAAGCDSIVTTVTTWVGTPDQTVNVGDCNQANAGTVVTTETNANGCQYQLTTITTWTGTADQTVNIETCNPSEVGTVVATETNGNGCDYQVTTNTTLSSNCGGCTYSTVNFNDFDGGWGIWNDGGSDCRRSSDDAAYANSGSFCIRLRDNTSTSTMTTDNLNLSNYDEIKIAFSYYARSMDNSNEDFWLQVSTNGGANFTTVEEWNRNDEFVNDQRYFDTVTIASSFTATTQFRFRCDASGNSDWIYIDDVDITGCSSAQSKTVVEENLDTEIENSNETELTILDDKNQLLIYPNPAKDILNIKTSLVAKSIKIYTINGALVTHLKVSEALTTINIETYSQGTYLVVLETANGTVSKKFIKY